MSRRSGDFGRKSRRPLARGARAYFFFFPAAPVSMGAGFFALNSSTAESKVSWTWSHTDMMSRSASRIAAVAVTSPVVCTRTFTLFSIGCGTLYPASDTCGFLFSMYRTALPIVWSSSFSVKVFS